MGIIPINQDSTLKEKFYEKLNERQIGVRFGRKDRLEYSDDIKLEQFSYQWLHSDAINSLGTSSYTYSPLPVNTQIGRFSSIGSGVNVMNSAHPLDRFTKSPVTYHEALWVQFAFKPDYWDKSLATGLERVAHEEINPEPIIIGNDVWIGDDVLLKRGITIGDGAVIGSRAIVTKDVPPYAIVGGMPAKIIRYQFSPEIIEKLLALQWWDYPIWKMEGIKGDDPIEVFIEKMETLIAEGKIEKWQPNVITANDLDHIFED
ncbi:MAG: CatB-related O-acetyltransferase [Streptococcaceae bacterium]|nr:CatB-related O-acetyltransferase [Streptococcaceae bacterium]MCL2681241.1 CatB-related O-acetyltransferase [Streptococcaceae bacterium]MCL2858634.1 CatB-related O-acetyltransferase [Streptococcaceae bacterium]